jgi:ferritin-like metal-binding protein YciE
MATKVLNLQDLFQRELADLARDEDLLRDALILFRKASKNQVLDEVLERIRLDAEDLCQRLSELAHKTKETRRDAVRGIIEEGQRRTREIGDHHLVDAELIITAQRLLGYQIAGYRSVLPLTRMMGMGDATLICETAVETKEKAVKQLQQTALHQVHWRASWWGPEHTSAWQKVKTVFREDWDKTKERWGISGEDEEVVSRHFDLDEPAFRYGYGAALHYHDREWNPETSDLLRSEYGGLWNEDTRPKVEAGWMFARRKYATT